MNRRSDPERRTTLLSVLHEQRSRPIDVGRTGRERDHVGRPDRMFGALADHTRRAIVRSAINAEEGVVELASHYPGDQPHGYWEVLEAEAPHRLVFRDGFANADGTPNTDLPMNTASVRIEEVRRGRTRMSIQSVFPSVEAMERVLAMGLEEGLTRAAGQIDAILAEDAVHRHAEMIRKRR